MCSKYKMVFRGNETPYRVCCSCYFDYKKESACFCHSSNLVPSNSSNSTEPLTKDDFQLLRVIGRGSFGKVLLVRGKRDKHVYALLWLGIKLNIPRVRERFWKRLIIHSCVDWSSHFKLKTSCIWGCSLWLEVHCSIISNTYSLMILHILVSSFHRRSSSFLCG